MSSAPIDRRLAVLVTATAVADNNLPEPVRQLLEQGIRLPNAFGRAATPHAWVETLRHGRYPHELSASGVLHDVWDPRDCRTPVASLSAVAAQAGVHLFDGSVQRALRGPALCHLDFATAQNPAHTAEWSQAVTAVQQLIHEGQPALVAIAVRRLRAGQSHCDGQFDLALHLPAMGSRTADTLVDAVDVLPTLLDWLSVGDAARTLSGRSFLPMLTGSGSGRDAIFSSQDFLTPAKHEPRRVVRTRDHRLVQRLGPDAGVELYDLRHDPDCIVDLAQAPDYRSVRAELDAQLQCWRAATGDRWLANEPSSAT